MRRRFTIQLETPWLTLGRWPTGATLRCIRCLGSMVTDPDGDAAPWCLACVVRGHPA